MADAGLILGASGVMFLQLWTHRHDGAVDGALMTVAAGILTTRLGVGVWLLRPGTGSGTDASQPSSTPGLPASPQPSPSQPSSPTS